MKSSHFSFPYISIWPSFQFRRQLVTVVGKKKTKKCREFFPDIVLLNKTYVIIYTTGRVRLTSKTKVAKWDLPFLDRLFLQFVDDIQKYFTKCCPLTDMNDVFVLQDRAVFIFLHVTVQVDDRVSVYKYARVWCDDFRVRFWFDTYLSSARQILTMKLNVSIQYYIRY